MRYSIALLRLLLPMLALMAVMTGIARAQDSVIHAPDCVRLGFDWREDGFWFGGSPGVESGYVALADRAGDLDGDGIDEFAWRRQWAINGPPSGTWMLRLSTRGYPQPAFEFFVASQMPSDLLAAGDFWGRGRRSLGIGAQRLHAQFAVFRGDSDMYLHVVYAEHPTLVMSVDSIAGRPRWMALRKAAAIDLDHDGADELLMLLDYISADSIVHNGDLWIFRGGPDFQLTTPRVMIHDVGSTFALADLDGDGDTDMVSADSTRVMFWRGGADDMTRWVYPDRTVRRTVGSSSAGGRFALLDCDGDGGKDIVFTIGDHPCLFRTGTGKSVWTRSFEQDDADLILPRVPVYAAVGHFCGSGRYESLALGGKELNILPGGPGGLSTISRAWYSEPPDSNLEVIDIRLAGDVNADGWDDLSCLVHIHYSESHGTVIRALGGPRYPDERGQRLGVDDETDRSIPPDLRVRPQPAGGWLNVAWGECLQGRPGLIVVHDLLGREVIRREVGEGEREALLACDDLPPGAYLVSLSPRNGVPARTVAFVKR
jgi:hypothetical protein